MTIFLSVSDDGKTTTISSDVTSQIIEVIHTDMVQWAANYDGPKFHAAIGDTPYHLTSITERFGGKDAVAAKTESDGGFNNRRAGGFMHQEWDGTNYVSFKPETWQNLGQTLHPGALLFMFGSSRTHWKMQLAQEQAGLDLYPIQWGWTYGTGMCTPAPVASKLGDDWKGYRYGADILTPALEPIVISQNPYPKNARRLDVIESTGAGTFNREAARNEKGNLPKNLYVQHNFDCTPEQCSANCPAYDFKGNQVYYNEFYWVYEVAERVMGMPGLFYQAKPTNAEREFGLDSLPATIQHRANSGGMANDPSWGPKASKNPHPTLKPIELTKQLAAALLPPESAISEPSRLICPFGGVGSEAIGAILAGWNHIVITEITENYIPVCVNRVASWLEFVESNSTTDVREILSSWGKSGDKSQGATQLSLTEPVQVGLGI